jgi:hypothetical protein
MGTCTLLLHMGKVFFSFSDWHPTLLIVFGMCIEYVFAIRHFNFYFYFLALVCTICTFTTQFSYLYRTLISQLHNLYVFESPNACSQMNQDS